MKTRRIGYPVAILVLAAAGCGKKAWTPTLHPPDQYREASRGAEYLKVHMRDGGLYVLSSWQVDEGRSALTGRGVRFVVSLFTQSLRRVVHLLLTKVYR